MSAVAVREARSDERPAVLGVLDGAMLETDRLDGSTLLVAVAGDRVLGALVLAGDHVDAVAVRRSRRGQGIGPALVEAAAARRERLVAEFREGVRPFYESLGFEVEPTVEVGRFRGVREPRHTGP